ncbi:MULTISPECIES: low temperature requirement protein A [Streptomyces]|uniref:Low temperature requirement protein A n=1 Tax=Streptomyces virginiae TaxID=1961 RepID=A0ABQ3NY66_STRVG|nr:MULTISPECIES: low temperature requirement protein A [Streptomyces]MBP2348646.1 low temperature requirement protein LtrA [Streptomyces virginiae]MCI4085361.1 low temperature requirement protein A [Streptomyces sp. MMS21 TC-5]QNE23638.1 low temperature requirement protein A [Streptomyces sp. INR7]GGQ00923.1 low temperature requirement protein A [Streptomyces virginiae]GHI17712.1 low temperature requirement protein A [Streptomyces virginiae]
MSAQPVRQPHADRHAGWLELFFDLVFVAFAAQLSHSLHGDPGPRDFAVFLALYFPPWWMWINLTVSANLFEDDSPRRRLLMLSAMFCLAAMAAAVPEADGDAGRAAVYALGYAGTRLVLLGLWWPATRLPAALRVPRWRPLSYCLVSALLWAASAAVPLPWRYAVWAVLLTAEMVLLLTARGHGITGRLHTGHLVERVGLFVIIVLGESVIALVTSTDHAWTAQAGAVATLGFVLLAALWWSYFDFGSTSAELMLGSAEGSRAYLLARDVSGFLHFFVTAAVISMAAGLATAVEEAGHAHLPRGAVWALAGGLALYHLAHACIAVRFGRPLRAVAVWAVPGIAVPLLVVLGAGTLAPWLVVLLLAAEAVGHLLYARTLARRRSR